MFVYEFSVRQRKSFFMRGNGKSEIFMKEMKEISPLSYFSSYICDRITELTERDLLGKKVKKLSSFSLTCSTFFLIRPLWHFLLFFALVNPKYLFYVHVVAGKSNLASLTTLWSMCRVCNRPQEILRMPGKCFIISYLEPCSALKLDLQGINASHVKA